MSGSFDRDLRNFAQKVKEKVEHNTQPTTLGELLNPNFMRRHTQFTTVEEMFAQCGFPASTREEIEAIPQADFDAFVARTTQFGTWSELYRCAGQELVSRRAR